MTTLITYTKTQKQENRLLKMLFGENTSKVESKPCLRNNNLLVRHFDLMSRTAIYEMDREGNLLATNF